jgi:hypothetical protein
MRFGTWKVKSIYRRGSLETVARKLSKYRLELVAVLEIMREKGAIERAEEYTFCMEKAIRIIS